VAEQSAVGLERGLGFKALVATNVMAMTGAGPFITIPLLVGAMGGSQALLGWVLGAVLSLADGLVWAELASTMPASGGGYAWLHTGIGGRAGSAAAFLLLWQSVVTTPVLVASGAVGFVGYAEYLVPHLTPETGRTLAIGLVALATLVLCRRTSSVGRMNGLLGVLAIGVILWAVTAGVSAGQLAHLPPTPGWWGRAGFLTGLGTATLYATYDYMGYQVACNLGDEVIQPARTLPRAVVSSILVVLLLYVPLNLSVLAVLPFDTVLHSNFVVSDLILAVYGNGAATIATLLILVVTFSSLVALLLGASRILWAAARKGQFPTAFAKLHPTQHYPRRALLVLGGVGMMCCVLPLDTLIEASTVMVIVMQSVPVLLAAVVWRRRDPGRVRPYRMWLYPIPVLLAGLGWAFVVGSSSRLSVVISGAAVLVGLCVHWAWQRTPAGEKPG
jgi:amino acid transporter